MSANGASGSCLERPLKRAGRYLQTKAFAQTLGFGDDRASGYRIYPGCAGFSCASILPSNRGKSTGFVS